VKEESEGAVLRAMGQKSPISAIYEFKEISGVVCICGAFRRIRGLAIPQ
jgi:hypothetical protein